MTRAVTCLLVTSPMWALMASARGHVAHLTKGVLPANAIERMAWLKDDDEC